MSETSCTIIEQLDYNAPQSELFQSIFICADRAANHEMSDDQIRNTIALLSSLYDGTNLTYSGYMGVICDSVEGFVFQCLTHFLGEGIDTDSPEYQAAWDQACRLCNRDPDGAKRTEDCFD